MRLLHLTVALSAGVVLLAGYSLKDRFLTPAGSTQEPEPRSTPSAIDQFAKARQLAWEAAVMVQNPPHPAKTWQDAKVKWRQAIRLMESIPAGTPVSAQAKQRLAVYRANYNAISQRLESEEKAVDSLETAQQIAWQAAVIVQNPPHPLRIWQRASQKWQEAITLLEPIPNTTSIAAQTQAKLAVYRTNKGEINQRIVTEVKARDVLQRFSEASKHLKALSTNVVSGLTIEQIGISYPEYVNLVQRLEADLNQFSSQSTGPMHPIYPELAAAVEDYQFALKLWNTYLNYKQANSQWLYDDLFNQLVPISWLDSSTLFQKYQVKTFSNGTKVSLRFSVWEIWNQAADRVSKAQQRVSSWK